MDNMLPDHLGGHMNRTHTDRGMLLEMIKSKGITSMLDIGCGPGEMVKIAGYRGLEAFGIDGDFTLNLDPNHYCTHDFTKGKATDPIIDRQFDLGWSIEFLEHVEEQYVDNFMHEFAKCKYVICTAAPPGQNGHHHVNCQPKEYWIDVFSKYGFTYNEDMLNHLKEVGLMRRDFFRTNGMYFEQ